MKMTLKLAVAAALATGLALPAVAQGPPRTQTKELSAHSPSWVQQAMRDRGASATINGMVWTSDGWKGVDPPLADDDVWHRMSRRPFSRKVYEVSFEKPNSYTATVVFEDYGSSVSGPPIHRSQFLPVLVQRKPPPSPVETFNWEYEIP